MGNFNIKIELDKLPGAKIMDIQCETTSRRGDKTAAQPRRGEEAW